MSANQSLGLRTSARETLAFVQCCRGFEVAVEPTPAPQNFPSNFAADFRSPAYSSGVIPDADPLRTAVGCCDIASWVPIAGGNPTAATYDLSKTDEKLNSISIVGINGLVFIFLGHKKSSQ